MTIEIKNRIAIIFAWLSLCVIWGSTWLVIKIGLQDLPPLTYAGLRFLISASILIAIIFLRGMSLPRARNEWQLLVVVGVLGVAVNYGLLFWGEQHISSGLASLLHATIPLIGMGFAHRLLPSERITWPKLMGVILGLAGLTLIFINQVQLKSALAPIATFGILLGGAAIAYCNVLIKVHGQSINTFVLAAGQMSFGFPILLGLGLATEGNPLRFTWTPLAWFCLLYLALVGSCAGFLLYFWLIKKIAVTKSMLIMLVTPLLAVSLGAAVNNEEVNWRIVVGGMFIIAGVGMNFLLKKD
ncbi:EamA family transporter [candidate division KSB1 bacterium]|nr:EamA family transporter [candidate division KSB1 bacterium]